MQQRLRYQATPRYERRVADGAHGRALVTGFTCTSCGFHSAVRLRGAGPDANEALSRVECPKCGYVERPFRPIRSAKLVLLGLLSAIASFVEALDGNPLWIFAGIACLVFMGWLFWRGLKAAALLRGSSVEFSDGPLPVTQFAGRTCAVCGKRIVMDDAGVWCSACGATSHEEVCAQRHALAAHAGAADPFRATPKAD